MQEFVLGVIVGSGIVALEVWIWLRNPRSREETRRRNGIKL